MVAADRALYASLVLRLGLGAVMLWFGSQQLMDPIAWTAWVPEWAIFLAPEKIVMLNGLLEVVLGSMLVLGVFVRPASAVLFIHLVVIIVDIGITEIGVRDIGIAAGLLALAFLGAGTYALMRDSEAPVSAV